jgi:multiple sugar transport system permease protein
VKEGQKLVKNMANRMTLSWLIVLAVIFMFPLLTTISNSFMGADEMVEHYGTKLSVFDVLDETRHNYVDIQLVPNEAGLSQYSDLILDNPAFIILMFNSLKLTLPVVLGSLIFSVFTAYGFTVWQWKHKETVFFIYIVVMLMPLQAVLVPNYIIAEMLGLTNSYLAIILPGIFSPFGTFLLRQSMKVIPMEYFEAAKVDGAGSFRVFFSIILPQMKSGMAALAMLVFIEYWNVVDQVVIFIREAYREPLSVFLSHMSGDSSSLIFAASVLYLFLPLWFLTIGQKELEQGIELSGIK